MSPGVMRESGPAARRKPSSLRAVSESLAPQEANSRAQAAPIPSEAPVMRTTLPSIRMRAHLRKAAGVAQKRHNGTMPKRLIPLFPLQLVVFPRTHIPLHIFEDRYKEMVGEAIRDGSEFGIVLSKEDRILNAGCTVMVEKVLEMYPDGRMDILTRGQRRFEIVSLNEEKEYLQGEVEFFDDDDLAPAPGRRHRRIQLPPVDTPSPRSDSRSRSAAARASGCPSVRPDTSPAPSPPSPCSRRSESRPLWTARCRIPSRPVWPRPPFPCTGLQKCAAEGESSGTPPVAAGTAG